jgi:hypothetical protein
VGVPGLQVPPVVRQIGNTHEIVDKEEVERIEGDDTEVDMLEDDDESGQRNSTCLGLIIYQGRKLLKLRVLSQVYNKEGLLVYQGTQESKEGS